ncbi:MAG TPA: T9SS type A sorting domain-containing protein, partial [Daejeonella sp.]|nr:T9SS type A sorting domain-containing protein [Daejeonella sp.]
PDANYTYNGTVAQSTGNGLPSVLNGILTVNTSVAMPGGVTISQPTRIRKLVDITRGRLISNGNLTIESTASSNGNVRGPSGGGVLTSANQYLTDNVNVESWFSGGDITYRGTRTISSPVNNAPIFEQLQQKMLITGQGAGFDAPATQETILTYYEPAKVSDGVLAQYQSLPASGIKTSPVPGLGYFLLYHGDRILDPSGINPPQSLTATYTGVINQGDIRVDLSFTNNTGSRDDEYNGFNLVGNPYPAVIDWAKVTRSDITKIDNMVSIIKPGGGMMTYSNGVVTNALPAGAPPPGNSAISFYIQPGQGFYVRTRAEGTFLTFTEASKAVSNSPVRLLSLPQEPFLAFNSIMGNAAPANTEPVSQVLRLHLQDSKNVDETAIVFQTGNKAVYGGADVTYFSGSSVSLSSVTSDGKNVAINFMPEIKKVSELKLWVNAAASGSVKLIFTDLKGVGEYQVFLKDIYLDKLVNVKLNPVYEFSIDKTNVNTFGSERFKLVFQAPVYTVAASITLKAKKTGNGVQLSFIPKGEKNNSPFEIERSADGKAFEKIAQVLSKSQIGLEYSYVDKNPLKGMSYYRLKQKGSADTWIYSNVFSLDWGLTAISQNTGSTLNIYPNPAVNEIRVNFHSSDRDLIMSVYNMSGKKMKEIAFKRQAELKGNISELSQGIYFIELSDATSKQIMGWAKFYKN